MAPPANTPSSAATTIVLRTRIALPNRLACTAFTKRRPALFASFYPAADIAAIQQPLAALRKEPLIIIAAIIRVRPFKRLPLPLPVDERHFRKNPLAQVDAVRMILRRSQDQLSRRKIPRIKIQRPLLCISPERRVFSFPIIGFMFNASQCG